MTTPYHLLLGRRDWQPLIDAGGEDVAWDREGEQLTLASDLLRFPRRASEQVYTAEDRRGAAADGFGHLYWIDAEEGAVRYRPAGGTSAGELWSVADFQQDCAAVRRGGFRPKVEAVALVPRLRGLTVTTRGYLVVGTLGPGGLLVFDLLGGGPPRWHQWPAPVSFEPFDMAAAPDGGLWVLDVAEGSGARLWYLDCALRVGSPPGAERTELSAARAATFRDLVDGIARTRPARSFPSAMPLTLDAAEGDVQPVGIEALPDGSLLLLDQGAAGDGAWIHRLECGLALAAPIDLNAALQAIYPDDPGFIAHDLAVLPATAGDLAPGTLTGTLYVAAAEGNQSFAFHLSASATDLELDASYSYLPMRRYAGKALVSAPGDVYYDQTDIWLALTELPRPRFAREGHLEGLVFDGKQPQCPWHRLFIDGCIPPGDAIVIESRAADDTDELQRATWRREQPLYLRGINRHELTADDPDQLRILDEGERPYHRPFASDLLHHKGVGTWELLFQQAIGRYLELRLTLTGSGRSSAKIRALRVHYPRLSYPQRFLPAAYREEPASAHFLERLLANFEGFYTELEARVAAVQILFDGRTAPGEALDWLAGWLGAALSEDWEESRRRLFIRHAVELYRQRGTPQGLVRAIRLAIEPCPDERLFDASLDNAPFGVRIVEQFASRTLQIGKLESGATTVLPAQVSATTPWVPSQGGARLHRLWREFLGELHTAAGNGADLLAALATAWDEVPASLGALRFSPLTPADAAHAADRAAFIDQRLGLPYPDIDADDVGQYRSYLARKHGSIDALNEAYGLTGSAAHASFAAIQMPGEADLPADGPALEDWFQFATVDVPAARSAHRFTVLVPVEPEQGPSERQHLLDRVNVLVERERPSHASFDVQLYWALFRVGRARVGLDTLLGEGSRFTSLVLDAGYIGEGLLGEDHPWNVTDRWVSGRDGAGAAAIG